MKVITFDISSSEFVIYNEEEWDIAVEGWRDELSDWDGCPEWDEEEVIEAMHGDEFFYEKVESL